jgi:uncharacterized short protein YbdD (DUF466 family)
MSAMTFRELASKLCESAKVIVGVPSYRHYCEHMAAHHPDRPVMTAAEFFRNRQDARYGRGSGTRCC